MMNFLSSALGYAVVGFYVYMGVAFYRRARVDHPDWSLTQRLTYAATWPATAWMAAGNPANK